MNPPEVWLRGPIDGVPPLLQPVAHSLLQSRAELARSRLPSTVIGLLVHAAEHTQRLVGQLLTTARIVKGARGVRRAGDAE